MEFKNKINQRKLKKTDVSTNELYIKLLKIDLTRLLTERASPKNKCKWINEMYD